MADNDSRLFAALRTKLAVAPSAECNRNFWESFREQFPAPNPVARRHLDLRLSLAFSFVILITASVLLLDRSRRGTAAQAPPVDVGFIQDLSHYEQLLDHYDEFSSISDVSLSDKDWAELVKHGAR